MTAAGGQSAYQLGNPASDVMLGHDPGSRTVRSNFDVQGGATVLSSGTVLTAGVMRVAALPLFTGDVVSFITVRSGATACVGPTNWWFALYDDNPTVASAALIEQTADQTSTAWGASTTMSKALVRPVTITRTGVYRIGIMVAAGTTPNLENVTLTGAGLALFQAALTFQQPRCGTAGSGLTTTAPSTLTGFANGSAVPVVIASSAI